MRALFPRMNQKFSLFAMAAVAATGVCMLSAGGAEAGGYFSLGVGADASLSGEMAQHFTVDEEGGSGRIAIGQRVGRVAIEVAAFGADVQSVSGLGGGQSYSTATVTVSGKFFVPISGRFEGYGKLGIDKTWLLSDQKDAPVSYAGRGYSYGGGLQYGFRGPLLGQAAIWLDFTRQEFTLFDSSASSKRDLAGGGDLVTVGFTIGF